MSDLDLMAILERAQQAYGKVLDQFIDADNTSASIRQHFNYDVPALIGAVQRLTAELDGIGGMRVIEHEGNRLRVITRELHDRLCTARVASSQGSTPDVLHCHFCGFCYLPINITDQAKGHARG